MEAAEAGGRRWGMTEEEWAKGMDARPMLNLLRDKATERKLRLFAVACCQSILLHLTDNRSLRGIAAAESYADSESSNNEFRRAAAQAFAASGEASGRFDNPHSLEARMLEFATRAASLTTNDGSIWRYASAAYQAAVHTADCVATARKFAPLGLGVKGGRPLARKERRFQAVLMSCIFGNPFRPVAFDPRWRTSDTVR